MHALALVPAAPAASTLIEAVVQAGSSETTYLRAGSGRPVLLLSSGGRSGPLTLPLVKALSSGFRVIAPESPGCAKCGSASCPGAPTVPVWRWLRDLIDGLGLIRPSIVADEAYGVAALAFALTDPERVDRLAILRREPDPRAAQEGISWDMLVPSGHPLLLEHLDPGADGCPDRGACIAERIAEFLQRPA